MTTNGRALLLSTNGRAFLLSTMSEERWQAHVMELARRGGWCGIHIRTSHMQQTHWATLQGIHAPRRRDDHDDVFGLPDWLFVRPGEPPVWAELKSARGELTDPQKRWGALLLAAGQRWYCWRPSDETEVEAILGMKRAAA